MPEMLQFCGRRLRVDKLAVKLCDTIGSTGMYRMRNAVHLAGVRCDGQAHGGCQAGCLVYWKEAWLKRVPRPDRPAEPASGGPAAPQRRCQRRLRRRPAKVSSTPDEERFSCQATELLRAAPERRPALGRRPVRAGRPVGQRQLCSPRSAPSPSGCSTSIRTLSRQVRCRGRCGSGTADGCPSSTGRLEKTPDGALGLQPGELVRVKSKEEIVTTLDVNNSNRGLSFDPEMLWYCGREARVLRRVERIIDERTGKLLRIKRPCIVLEGVTCRGAYHRCCPRADYPYWREIWLERVE